MQNKVTASENILQMRNHYKLIYKCWNEITKIPGTETLFRRCQEDYRQLLMQNESLQDINTISSLVLF